MKKSITITPFHVADLLAEGERMPVDDEFELLPGLRLVPAQGHTCGLQMVVIETGRRPIIIGGDVAVGSVNSTNQQQPVISECARSTLRWSGLHMSTNRGCLIIRNKQGREYSH